MPTKLSPYHDQTVTVNKDTFDRLKKYCIQSKIPMKRITEIAISTLLDRLEKGDLKIRYEKKAIIYKEKKEK